MWKAWQIIAAIALGVAANLLTPYIKSIFRRGSFGLRKMRIEVIETEISDSYFFNKNPIWLVLHILKHFVTLFFHMALALIAAGYLFNQPYWAHALIANVLAYHAVYFWRLRTLYNHTIRPDLYEAKARKKIAKLTGKEHSELEGGDDPPRP